MSLLRKLRRDRPPNSVAADNHYHETTFVHDGNLKYAVEKGENSEEPSYQEVSGAPVESRSPLGYHVGAITIVSRAVPRHGYSNQGKDHAGAESNRYS